MQNRGNTCFMDSVLFALFYHRFSYVEQALKRTQEDKKGSLKDINDFCDPVEDLAEDLNLRKVFAEYFEKLSVLLASKEFGQAQGPL